MLHEAERISDRERAEDGAICGARGLGPEWAKPRSQTSDARSNPHATATQLAKPGTNLSKVREARDRAKAKLAAAEKARSER